MKTALFTKRQVLTAASIAVPILIIFVAGKSTWQAAMKYRQLNKQLSVLNVDEQLPGLNRQEAVLFRQQPDLEQSVFSSVSRSCQQNQVNLRQIRPALLSTEGSVGILTQQVTLQGDFIKILKSLEDVQKDLQVIKITSLRFELEEINKVQSLVAHVYFQGVKQVDEK